MTTTFAQASEDRENNLDFLRFFFASMVIVAHSYSFLYNGMLIGYDPLVRFSNGQVGLGSLAVNSFFLISGFLITSSWLRSKGVWDYARKRILRILPGLIAVLFFCMLIVGPLATSLPLATYFRCPDTYRYLGFMLHPSLHVVDKLPGVFLHNPEPGRVNGSLWTIRQEVVCYAFIALMGVGGIYRRPALLLCLAVVPYMLTVRGVSAVGTGGIHDFFYLLTYFMLGMLLYLYRDRVLYSRGLLLSCVVLIAVSGTLGCLSLFLPVCLAYVLFYIAFNKRIRLQHFAKHGDLSYGVYLYAFPVQQLLVGHYRHSLNALTLTILSLTICSGLAALSWRYVEQPFLKLKSKPNLRKIEMEAVMQQSVVSDEIVA